MENKKEELYKKILKISMGVTEDTIKDVEMYENNKFVRTLIGGLIFASKESIRKDSDIEKAIMMASLNAIGSILRIIESGITVEEIRSLTE